MGVLRWWCQGSWPGRAKWYEILGHTGQRLLNLARAHRQSERAGLHRPIEELDESELHTTLELLREFVDNRGVALPAETCGIRHPRTAFFSVGHNHRVHRAAEVADRIWWFSRDRGLEVSPGGSLRHAWLSELGSEGPNLRGRAPSART